MIEDADRLEELGFLDGINEVVVTTQRDGTNNAAPIGIIKDGKSLKIRLFGGTHTYENILAEKSFVANVVHDPMIFVESALSELQEEAFEVREGLLTLKSAESWALFKCEAFPLDIVIGELEFIKGDVIRKEFRAVNRGINLVVESAIAATRYLALNIESYMDDIRKNQRIISRCGGKRDREAMDRLMDLIESHKPF
jgi:uncharacterized protein